MSRDLSRFPHDSIGDLLWQRQQTGENLATPREIEFSVLFSSQALALKFGQLLLENNQKLSFSSFQENEGYPWEITAYPEMPLDYDSIAGYQALLESSSAPMQGKFDGFYCL